MKDDMTLRQRYAGMAMQGILANSSFDIDAVVVAKIAYEHADAMLKEETEEDRGSEYRL